MERGTHAWLFGLVVGVRLLVVPCWASELSFLEIITNLKERTRKGALSPAIKKWKIMMYLMSLIFTKSLVGSGSMLLLLNFVIAKVGINTN
ncbi:hypothetical protein EJB05_12583, partial [Eragrostis curvula]